MIANKVKKITIFICNLIVSYCKIKLHSNIDKILAKVDVL